MSLNNVVDSSVPPFQQSCYSFVSSKKGKLCLPVVKHNHQDSKQYFVIFHSLKIFKAPRILLIFMITNNNVPECLLSSSNDSFQLHLTSYGLYLKFSEQTIFGDATCQKVLRHSSKHNQHLFILSIISYKGCTQALPNLGQWLMRNICNI